MPLTFFRKNESRATFCVAAGLDVETLSDCFAIGGPSCASQVDSDVAE
jgi:hypothetical protein